MIRKMKKSDIPQIKAMLEHQEEEVKKLKPGKTNRYGHKTKAGRPVFFSHVV